MRLLIPVWLLLTAPLTAAPLPDLLSKPILPGNTTLEETQRYLDPRIPRLPALTTREAWEADTNKIRQRVFDQVIFRGEAATWREFKGPVEMLDTIAGGEGYRLRKLRFEVVPGMWVPAILYQPEKIGDRVAVMLAVNGHDGNGKAAGYKQTRCINLAKRGMYVLNLEWFGMGQLRSPGFAHSRMNLLDLCGTSGLAPFYLAMSRGIDILLDQPNADRTRVAVSGLSGGGWQTITISGLDTRVTLTNPVAGYSSFRTRIQKFKDLGDSEQTPCDLAYAGADYAHLTAMLAPRAALLTFNAKDNCCFEAGYALPPLFEAAAPVYKLFGVENKLRTHINQDPGDHNFGIDNRQALYRMVGDHFFAGQPFDAREIPCEKEIKTKDELAVALPTEQIDFQKMALKLSQKLPKVAPDEKDPKAWQTATRRQLHEVLRLKAVATTQQEIGTAMMDGVKVRTSILHLAKDWTVPLVEFTPAEPKGTTIVLHDEGRTKAGATIEALLKAGQRVVAVDVWYFGECKFPSHAYLFGLMLGTVGDRPLGVQVQQLLAVVETYASADVRAIGPRTSLIALTAAALSERIRGVQVERSLASLREVIEENRGYDSAPEQFCFGLLETVDIPHLARLVAPRPVGFREANPRLRESGPGLVQWYERLGVKHDPFAAMQP